MTLLNKSKMCDNVLCMDRVLKQIGQKLAREEPPRLPRTLPSSDFIKFYFSSWAHNPFTLEAMKIKRRSSADAERATNGPTEAPVEAEEVFKLPKKLASAYTHLEEAFKKLQISEYEESWNLVATAVKLFNSAPNVDLHAFERSIFGDREKPESARARALLLEATFMALSGDAEEAKARFLSIGEALFAHPTIRVNALIKAGALYMTIDKDISGCMYCFQQAQTLNPLCPDVYLHRGQINLLAENLEAAEKDLCEAVRLRPDFSVAQACVPAQWLYLLYRKSDKDGKSLKIEEHLKEFQKLIEKWPNCVETHSLYAQILTERGEFQKSDDEFARIIELSPNSGLAYSHRGLLQLRWKQDQDAADNWFRRAVEVDPRCELAWELRGQLAMERGELEKAEKYFQRALDEARTSQDRSHLFALREGVKAQIHAAEVYGISIASLFAEIRNDFQRRIPAGGDGIPVPV
ncbi:Mitochondrial import receptor subunit TOM70 [Taenia solium]|eukprot:TsM_000757000 transcript=TsM_000757000 gene=TsM_000757000